MTDIAKCQNEKCPSKDHCYRYTCPASEHWQSYMDFKVKEGKEKCDSYLFVMPVISRLDATKR